VRVGSPSLSDLFKASLVKQGHVDIATEFLRSSPGVLRSALEPSAQEGHGTVGAGPKEGYKNDPRAGVPLL